MTWAFILAVVLGLLWVLGIGSSYSFGGYLHILIFAALVLAAFLVIKSRRHRDAP